MKKHKWGTERLNNLARITELAKCGARNEPCQSGSWGPTNELLYLVFVYNLVWCLSGEAQDTIENMEREIEM